MPDDSNGRYSLPAGYAGVTGQTILTSQHNPPLEDLATAMTNRLPRAGTAPMLGNLPMGGNKVTGLGNGTASDDAATFGQITAILPVGAVIDYAGGSAPTGWLFLAGQAISRTTYAALFTIIGTTFGAGDGSTTFNLPDARGRAIAGKDDMGGTAANRLTTQVIGTTLGASGGSESVTLTVPQIPGHTHTGTTGASGTHHHDIPAGGSTTAGGVYGVGQFPSTSIATNDSGAHSHPFTTDSTGGGGGHNNVQPTLVLNKIIKTGV